MAAASDYPVGSLKQERNSLMVAIRTIFDDGRDWKVVGLQDNHHYVPHEEVQDWPDMRLA